MSTATIPANQPLENSKTHRLTAYKSKDGRSGYMPLQNEFADELDELRAFIKFLFPDKGQDRFVLHRPDILEPRWTVYDRAASSAFSKGFTPLKAVNNARQRLEAENTSATPLKLSPT